MPEAISPGISVLSEAIPDCQWHIQYHLNPELLTGDIHRLRDRLLIISAVAMLTAALTTWLSSRKISQPVSRILQQMDRVQQGDPLNKRKPSWTPCECKFTLIFCTIRWK